MKKSNENGSTIVMGIVIVMIIFVILGTALAIALNYQQRSIDEHARKQAYLNGISVVDTIAGEISTDNQNFIPTETQSEVKITDVNLPSGHTGVISAVIKYDTENKSVLYIQVTSTYNNQTEEVQLALMKQSDRWKKVSYSKIGEEINHEEK